MSIETRPEVEDLSGEIAESNGHAPASLLGRIAAVREERVADESILIGIPTWDNDLVGKFVVLGEPEREAAAKKLERGDDNSLDFHVSVLNGSCEVLYMRDPDTDQLVALEHDGEPLGFDTRVTDMLGVECEKVRDVLLYLVKDNRIALHAFGQKVLDWMTDTSREVEGALVGESLA